MITTEEPMTIDPLIRTLQRPAIWRRYRVRIWVGRLLGVAAFLAAWALAAGRIVDANLSSNPGAVATQLWDWTKSGYIFDQTWVTLKETLVGFLIGGIAGVVSGLALGLHRWSGDVGEPFLIAAYGLPKVALAPVFVVWFGIGITMKVVLAALSVFFLVFFNTYTGVRQTNPEVVDVVRTMGANRRQIIWKVVLPGAKSWIFTGLRLGLPYGFVGAIVGEIVASNKGLGYLVTYSASVFDTAGLMAALVTLIIVTSILNFAIGWQERRSLRWQSRDGSAVGRGRSLPSAGSSS